MIETNAETVAEHVLEQTDQFEDRVDEEIDRALSEAKRLARSRAPVDTGRLRDSVSIDLGEDVLYSDVEYATFVDQGTIYMEATHFMEDSAREAFRNSIERLEDR